MRAVLVAGYFDGMHSGHARFFESASKLGRVIVGVGCDERLMKVKGVTPMYDEAERLFMVQNCAHVTSAFIIPEVEAVGGVTWERYLDMFKPTHFAANNDLTDDWLTSQREVCLRHGVNFVLLNRDQEDGLAPRSSTGLRRAAIPYRTTLTTGMDQMQLSRVVPGPCVGFSIRATHEFEDGSGMATSTRKTVQRIWGANGAPRYMDPVDVAKIAFAVENTPKTPVEPDPEKFPWGTYASRYITGSIDPITVLVPGASCCRYAGGPWPDELETITNPDTMRWLSRVITMVQTRPRPASEHYELVIDKGAISDFALASENVWRAVKQHDTEMLASSMTRSMRTFGRVCPTYLGNGCGEQAEQLLEEGVQGVFVQGAGHGGYIACVSEDPGDRIPVVPRVG